MPALANTTNLDLHTRCADTSYSTMVAGPSCQVSPLSPQFGDDFGRRGSVDEGDTQLSERALAKQRECATRVAAWINQSAVRITAFTIPSIASTASLDFDLDLDLDLEDEEVLYDSDFRYVSDGEPYLFYSSSRKSVGTPVVHAPVPKRPSRSRSKRRHHHAHRPRVPSPLTLYVIREEPDSEDSE